MKILLAPFSFLFGAIVLIRNWAFNCGLLKAQSLPVPVISVGNISVGGTGKTPFTMLLISYLKSRGLRPGLISRGYGGTYKGVVEVDTRKDWKQFGDEPVMIKTRFPEVPIFLAHRRVEAGLALLEKYKVDVMIADDAFQHRYLKRDMDIVLLDSTQPESDYHLLPRGLLRECFTALNRAQLIIITKANLLAETEMLGRLKFLDSKIKEPQKVLSGDLEPSGLMDGEGNSVAPEKVQRVYLLSGIGRPQAFETSVKNYLGRKIERHWEYSDHHQYTEDEISKVFSELPADQKLVTTEKDFVRLKDFSKFRSRFLIFKVDMEIRGDGNEFLAQITRLGL